MKPARNDVPCDLLGFGSVRSRFGAGLTRTVRRIGAPIVLGILATALHAPTSGSEVLQLGGTGSAIATMERIGAAMAKAHPGFSVKVVPNLGSSGGIKALTAGVIDIALTSRPLKAAEASTGLVAIEYGRTPFVLVANHPAATAITIGEAEELIAGRRTQWPDGTPVRVVLRPKSDGDTEMLQALSAGMRQAVETAHARPGMVVGRTDQDNADLLERLPGAFGASSLALVTAEQRKLRVLKLNDVAPSPALLRSGAYPHVKRMFLVVRPDASAQVKAFVEFVRSPQARAILEATDHWVPDAVAERDRDGAALARR